MTATYTRGTATTKITTNRLTPGTALLTADLHRAENLAGVADKKSGAMLRIVSHTQRVAPGPFERNTRVVVHFTDGTHSPRYSASQTWMALVVVSEPVADAIEAAREEPTTPAQPATVTAEERTAATAMDATIVPAAEETKAYRIGKLLLNFILEHSGSDRLRVSSELFTHIASRNVCYDGTATLRLTPAWAEELINAASEMDAEAKAAARAARRTLYALFA